MAHAPTTPPVAPVATPKPKVTLSPIWKIRILVFSALLLLTTITVVWNQKPAKYELSTVEMNDSLVFTLDPGKSAKVTLTNDDCYLFSTGPVKTTDQYTEVRILEGNHFVQGPPLASTSLYYYFENTGTESIKISIKRG